MILKNLLELRSLGSVTESFLREWYNIGGRLTSTGANVSQQNAMNYIAFYQCVNILVQTIASTPLIMYKRLKNGGKERATGHNLYNKVKILPNPDMAAGQFKSTLQGHLATWGNAYAQVIRDRGQRVTQIRPLLPDHMTVTVNDGVKTYEYQTSQGKQIINPYDLLHIKGFGFDGIMGYSPVTMAREALGLGMSLEEYAARFFGSGAHPGGIIEYPGKMTPETQEKYRESFSKKYGGLGKTHELMFLDQGFKYTSVGIPPDDAQFLESRLFQKREMAAMFRIPAHMVGDNENSTFSNIEHQSLEFIRDTMLFWFTTWEEEFYKSLLNDSEKEDFFFEFLVDNFLRGDIKTRYEAYNAARIAGFLNVDDIREKENMNPLPDGKGQIYLEPLNMKEAGTFVEAPVKTGVKDVAK